MKKFLVGLSISAAALLISGCTSATTGTAEHESSNVEKKERHGNSHYPKAQHSEIHWGYDGFYSPDHWNEFSSTCGEGQAQSPINIISGNAIELDGDDVIQLEEDVHTHGMVVDNGHSIKVTPDEHGNVLFHGHEYELLQFHFHGKSEHTVDGKRYDLVAHMVHQDVETKQLLVVAVFFEEGKPNSIIEDVIYNIGSKIKVDPKDLLPKDNEHFYHYVGSLTTPPCTENVQWYIMKQPNTASKEQIEEMQSFYIGNERPVQALHDRVIEGN